MMRFPPLDRRLFLQAVAAGLSAGGAIGADAAARPRRPICIFTKPFNSLSFDALADALAQLGVDGIEAPIRRGGHVEPEQVEDRLPALVEALAQRDLHVTVMTSDINDPDDPLTERQLKTAASLGIRRYRMQYFKYDLRQPILRQLDELRPQLRDLAAMNAEIGITGLYQNHAGRDYVGASVWDLARLLAEIDPAHLGVAYDIRHATAEGGTSWPVTLRMIRPHIDTVYVKDFRWEDERLRNVPLGEGRVDPGFVDFLNESDFAGPISLHEEYLDHRDPDLVPQHLEAIERDLAVLRGWLDA